MDSLQAFQRAEIGVRVEHLGSTSFRLGYDVRRVTDDEPDGTPCARVAITYVCVRAADRAKRPGPVWPACRTGGRIVLTGQGPGGAAPRLTPGDADVVRYLDVKINGWKEPAVSQHSADSFKAKGTLEVGDASYDVFRLSAVEGSDRLPYSLKVLLENLLRTEDGANITADHIRALAAWDPTSEPDTEIQFTPARVIMQDFTGVPVHRRPGHHARGRRRARRRPGPDQPARAGRDGHRPLGHRRRVRPRRRVREERRAGVPAQR